MIADFPNAGFQGEFAAQLISDTNSNYTFEIENSRQNVNSKSPRLEQQVNAWLNELMPGVSVSASYSPDTHSAQIKVDNYYTKGDPTIATNIGFGISYVLPILVTEPPPIVPGLNRVNSLILLLSPMINSTSSPLNFKS